NNKVNPEFLTMYLSILYSKNINSKYIKQNTGIQNLDIHEYFNEPVALPSIKEQKEIVEFVNGKLNQFGVAHNLLKNSIIKLNEFKSSLISNAVTGKIKV